MAAIAKITASTSMATPVALATHLLLLLSQRCRKSTQVHAALPPPHPICPTAQRGGETLPQPAKQTPAPPEQGAWQGKYVVLHAYSHEPGSQELAGAVPWATGRQASESQHRQLQACAISRPTGLQLSRLRRSAVLGPTAVCLSACLRSVPAVTCGGQPEVPSNAQAVGTSTCVLYSCGRPFVRGWLALVLSASVRSPRCCMLAACLPTAGCPTSILGAAILDE